MPITKTGPLPYLTDVADGLAPNVGDVLTWDGSQWVAAIAGSGAFVAKSGDTMTGALAVQHTNPGGGTPAFVVANDDGSAELLSVDTASGIVSVSGASFSLYAAGVLGVQWLNSGSLRLDNWHQLAGITPTAGQLVGFNGTEFVPVNPPAASAAVKRSPKIATGRWISWMTQYQAAGTTSVQSAFANEELAIPFYWEYDYSFDRMGLWVAAAGGAGSTVRVGIRNDDAGGVTPGTVRLDAGTMDLSTTGGKTITIAHTAPAGRYWLCIAPSASCSFWCHTNAPMPQMLGGNDQTDESRWLSLYKTLTPGFAALPPAAWGTISGRYQIVPHVSLRIA